MTGFEQLHPAVQHHVVNSLGWRSLRPLQEAAIVPVLAGDHVLAMAPTAGGKTEAAILPVLSRMLTDDWRGLTVLYVCPLRALLNNLHERLSAYAELVGRRVGLWHGDVTTGQRDQLLNNPPDILLTTPESLEAMLVSTRVAHDDWFASLQVVVIDEAHAFVADDRGWHLLAVLARLSHLAGRELQRLALSATIGNPDDVLAWLTTGCHRSRHVISPPVSGGEPPDVTLDYVGNLDNAATVIARLHRGAKRLVFVDSRARAEQLAAALRDRDVTTFVSHGSLGLDERRQAERAFAEERDCVIVATSTLELGIDVGDLDHVIQIDSPPSVASFLQRLGRAGRRAGSTRNMLVLATGDAALVRAAAVLLRWSEEYVEPTEPPALPLHLIGQQVLAVTLQEGQIGRHTWREWFGEPFVFGVEAGMLANEVVDHLVAEEYLNDLGGDMFSIGISAESELGRRHFMELLAVFTSPPLFSVLHGRVEIGQVPDEALLVRPPGHDSSSPSILLLAGKSWLVTSVDWRRRKIQVEPTDDRGVARWNSGSGFMVGPAVARGVREVLVGSDPSGVQVSRRAADRLREVRSDQLWVRSGATTVLAEPGGAVTWWTFAGRRANLWLAALVAPLRRQVSGVDDLTLALDHGTTGAEVSALLSRARWPEGVTLADWVSDDAIRELKFSDCVPRSLAVRAVHERLRDDATVAQVIGEQVVTFDSGA